MTLALALSGPAHLQPIKLEPGQSFHSMVDAAQNPSGGIVQTFTYKLVEVGSGSGIPRPFLIPSHVEGAPKDIAAWVFNRMLQALMSPHPMAGNVLLSCGFIIRDEPVVDRRVIRAEVRGHAVGSNGIVQLAPIDKTDANTAVDHAALRHVKEPREMMRELALRTMMQAFRPFAEKAVDHVCRHERW